MSCLLGGGLYRRERDTSRRDDQYSKAEANTILGHGGS